MNLVCPNCQKTLTVADQHAGQMMKCPMCSHDFRAPVLPGVPAAMGAPAPPSQPPSSAPQPPGSPARSPSGSDDVFGFAASPPSSAPRVEYPAPPVSAPEPPKKQRARETPPSPPPPVDYQQTLTIWISPRVVPWIAPVALLLVFVLMWFPWIDYPGKPPTTQTGWGTAFGHYFSALGIFFVLFFLPALALAVACLAIPRLKLGLPPAVKQFWPWRALFYGGLALLAFLFLLLQLLAGFGLEDVADVPSAVTRSSSKVEEVLNIYMMRRTPWLALAALCQLTALVGALLELWLTMRKNRPIPKIDIRW